MRRKYLVVALTLLMLVATVATGIHVFNKEVRADQLHRIKVVDHNGAGIAGIYCIIWVLDHFEGEMEVWNFHQGWTDGNGCFDVFDVPHSQATYWQAWVDEDDLEDNDWQLAPGQASFESVFYQVDGFLWICNCVPDL